MKKIRNGRREGEAEGFVWVTFSDLLSTLFMVFMIIALWAIANRDKFIKQAESDKRAGDQCLAKSASENLNESEKQSALNALASKISIEFQVLQKNGLCRESELEVIDEPGGFRIFQKDGYNPWFETGRSELSVDARSCLSKIGQVWIGQINNTKNISSRLRHVLIEGHANSESYPGLDEKQNFLRNLGLSQARAYEAAKHLIERHNEIISTTVRQFALRELVVAQGKSNLVPVYSDSTRKIEDFERSKRLEFKVVLGDYRGH